MPIRPVAQAITFTTSTGTFGPAYFGTLQMRAAIEFVNASTKSVKGSLQRSLGASGLWTEVIALTTTNTTGNVQLVSTSTGAFDKLRVLVTDNELTSTSPNYVAWLGAGPI